MENSSFKEFTILKTLFTSDNTIIQRANYKGKEVILKELNREYPTPNEIYRFEFEFKVAEQCSCDEVVSVSNFSNDGNRYFFIMEDSKGLDLKSYVKSHPLTVKEFITIALAITKGLQHIHSKQIIHKDINPSNIIINPQDTTIKIIDFGISSLLPREQIAQKAPEFLEGTLSYISPEQTGRINRSIDYRTDFYSLGVTLYELLTGVLPFSTTEKSKLVHCHIAQTPQTPTEIDNNIPQILSDIIMKLMEKDSEKRYQSASGLIHDLEKCLQFHTSDKALMSIAFQPGTCDIPERLVIPEKMYGRERELHQLQETLIRTASGRTELVTITGFSGVGKTTLVRELYKSLSTKHGYFISGKFDQFQHNVPYSAVVQAFRKLVQLLLTESEEQIQQWKEKIVETVGANGAVITNVLPEVELIIGKQTPVPELSALENQKRFGLLFKEFMALFCTPDHPVVLFLDDLQWVDSASLNLFELLAESADTNALLLILAYRDNEVHQVHPLSILLHKLREKEHTIGEMRLIPLASSDIGNLLSDTLHLSSEKVSPLTQLIIEKTEGNPFFVDQFLISLYKENHLYFDQTRKEWKWNIEQIRALNMTDNVIDLMIQKLQKLPQSTQKAAQLSAMIGNHFDLETLATIYEKDKQETFEILIPLLEEGLILPVTAIERGKSKGLIEIEMFQFLHDRVQQAAYSLVNDTIREQIHLSIGRLILATNDTAYIEENLFELTSHLNRASALISTQEEILQLVKLNLRSGIKSRGFTSYDGSFTYLSKAFSLLPEDLWEHDYDLAYEVSIQYCESGFLAKQFETAEKVLNNMLSKVKTPYERASIYHMQATQYIALERTAESLVIFNKGLKELQFNLSLNPSPLTIIKELISANSLRKKKSVDEIVQLPKVKEPRLLLIAKILAEMIMPAFLVENEALFALVSLKQVELALKQGLTPDSPFGFTSYGVMLGAMGKYQESYEAGQIGLILCDTLPEVHGRAGVLFMETFYIYFLNKPIDTLENKFQEAIDAGKRSGELFWLAWSIVNAGARIPDISLSAEKEKLNHYHKLSLEIGYLDASDAVLTLIQCNKALQGLTKSNTSLSDDTYDENAVIEKMNGLNKSDVLAPLYLFKCKTAVIHDRSDLAHKLMPEVDKRRKVLDGNADSITHTIYAFIAEATCYPILSGKEKKNSLKRMKWELKRVTKRAKHYEYTFGFIRDMMRAELSALSGAYKRAEKLFQSAISRAKELRWYQYIALFTERYALYWIAQENHQIGSFYIKEAYYHYSIWGATVKLKLMEEKYAFLKEIHRSTPVTNTIPPSSTTTSTSTLSTSSWIDLNSILRASNTLCSEIILEKLLQKMIAIVIENSGAERGVLLLPKQNQWFIEAEGFSSKEETTILQSIPLKDTKLVPESVINYVVHSKKSLVIANGLENEQFRNDSYIIQKESKSILCTPLLNQGKLTGVLYLENSLTSSVFTPDRVEFSNMLLTQAAISIENSQQYTTLEDKVEQRTRELEKQAIELKDAKEKAETANKAKSDFIANMSHEIRTPMNAVLGFTEILREQISAPKQSEYLHTIYTSGTALLHLINDVLDLSKIESGKMDLAIVPTSLANLVQEIHTIFYPKIANKGLVFKVSVNKEIPPALLLDDIRLRQVLINLLGNAIKFTDHGFIHLEAAVEKREEESQITLKLIIEDTGIGIPLDQQERIFDSFEQVKGQNLKLYGGTGLGLAIANRLVTLMGGTIQLASTYGKGSTFTITLPNVEITSEEFLQSEIDTFDPNSVSFSPATILVADDIEYNREIIEAFLAPFDLTILQASNGKEAFELSKKVNPDLIIMDMKMPIMNGYEAAEKIHAEESLKGVPIVAVTASTLKRDEAIVAQISERFLRKPISKKDLVETLMDLLPHEVKSPKEMNAVSGTLVLPESVVLRKMLKLADEGYLNQINEMVSKLIVDDDKYTTFAKRIQQFSSQFDDDGLYEFLEKHL